MLIGGAEAIEQMVNSAGKLYKGRYMTVVNCSLISFTILVSNHFSTINPSNMENLGSRNFGD